MRLLHGAGAATHSWRDLAPKLAQSCTVAAPDLPGHGFTGMPGRDGLKLNGMAKGVAELMTALNLRPDLIVGHSAGAAIALRMQMTGAGGAAGVVAINGALSPFPGVAGHIFPTLARLLFLNPAAIGLFAWRARQPGVVERLMESTGSRIDAAGLEGYRSLIGASGHVAGTLGMMSGWDLNALAADFARYQAPLTLIASEGDLAVPIKVSREARGRIAGAKLIRLGRLGHLAHEEDPDQIAALILEHLLAHTGQSS